MTRATVDGLQSLVRPEDVAALRGKTIAEVLPVSGDARRAEAAEEPSRPEASEEPAEATEEPAAEVAEETERVSELKITQVRSGIGQSDRHLGTLRALGLGKIGRSAEHKDSPQLQGHAAPGPPSRDRRGALSSRERRAEPLQPEAGAAAQGPQADRPRARLRQGPLLRAAASRARSRAPARTRCRRASRAARCPSTCASASSAATRRRTRCRSGRSGRTASP